MPRRWSSSCARRAFHHPSFTVAHKPACNLFQLTAEENEDPARAIAPARVITNQAEQHMHQPDDEAYREKLCPAVSNPDTSEAEMPSAKKQRAAHASAISSNEVPARQHARQHGSYYPTMATTLLWQLPCYGNYPTMATTLLRQLPMRTTQPMRTTHAYHPTHAYYPCVRHMAAS